MSRFICKIILHRTSNPSVRRNPTVSSLRSFSSSDSDSDQEQSRTVSYLINSVGLSRNHALSASKLVSFDTPEKPDNVIKFLENCDFTRTQISMVVRKYPVILLSNSAKTILPKLEFLRSKGISGLELAKMLSVFPSVFRFSLEKQIIPSYDFLQKFLQCDAKTIAAVKRYPSILGYDLRYVVPNIKVLQEFGVSDSRIAYMLHYQPRSFVVNSERYRKVVENVAEMGFTARQANFVVAVFVSVAMAKSTWQGKVDTYKKWGLSDEEVLQTFRKNPWCMAISEAKINEGMSFFVNELGWSVTRVATYSKVLSLSLKRRVIPRCSVFRVLLAKDLENENVSPSTLLLTTEDKFLKRFVKRYEKTVPELLKLYKKKLSL